MSRSVAAKHLRVALSRWPQDILRPETQFPATLAPRIERLERGAAAAAAGTTPSAGTKAATTTATAAKPAVAVDGPQQLREANALFALLDNRFKNRYRVREEMYNPRSRPTYYTDLIKELDEAPTRSIWSSWMNRIKGMVRLE